MSSRVFLPLLSPKALKGVIGGWVSRVALTLSQPTACPNFTTQAVNEATPQATPTTQPWRIVAATCVQRMPLLSREKSDIELRVEELKDRLRADRSRLSDFELEERENKRLKREREKRALEEDIGGQASKDDRMDEFDELQESREAELNAFKPAAREMDADENGDLKSSHRKLDQVLYLLVKKGRKEHSWQMPQGGVEGNESLLEAAKRELAEECGVTLEATFLSSAPSAYLSYKHPGRDGVIGSKVFFFKANYVGGELELNTDELVDYVWVTKNEMKDYVSQDLYSSISAVLPD